MLKNSVNFFSRLWVIILSFILNFLVFYTYKNTFSVLFSYQKFYYYEKSNMQLIAAFFYSIFPSFWIRSEIKKPSDLISLFLYFFAYSPAIIIGSVSSINSFFDDLQYYNVLLICMLIIITSSRINWPFFSISKLGISKLQFIYLVVTFNIIILFYLSSIYRIGDISKLLIFEVYDTRIEARSTSSSAINTYLLRLIGNSLGPTIFYLGLKEKKIILTILGIISNFLIFLFDGTKSTLFILLPVLFLFFFNKKNKQIVVFFILLINIFLIASYIIDINYHTNISSYLVRRVFAVPGLLTRIYYDIFCVEPSYSWSYNFLKFFSEPIYSLPPPFFVGKFYFGKIEMSANANLWADGFSNHILFGPLIVTILLIPVLKILDGFSIKNPDFSIILFVGPGFSLTNSSFFTAFLTHGIFWSFLLLILSPPDFPDEN